MPTVVKSEKPINTLHIDKGEIIRMYYQLVKKGSAPEQTRRDLGLSLQDIEDFDFTIFNRAV